MATIPVKILLFLFAAVIAGGAAAYFGGVFEPALDRQATAPPPTEAPEAAGKTAEKDEREAQTQASAPPADTAGGEETEPRAAEAASDEAGEAGETGKEQVVIPVFDILRAEPDGSLVVAGNAAANAEVEVLNGSAILAVTQAGPSGDFVAVLDEPLKPGEHNIVLRATSPDNVVATSKETAIVSIPSSGSTEVVALVQQPGEPSRLISVPEASATGEAEETVEAPAGSETPAEPETPVVAEAPGDEAGGSVEEPAEAAEEIVEQAETAAAPTEDSGEEQAGAQPAPEEPEIAEASAERTPEAPEPSGEEVPQVAEAPSQPASEEPEIAQAPAERTPETPEAGGEEAPQVAEAPSQPAPEEPEIAEAPAERTPETPAPGGEEVPQVAEAPSQPASEEPEIAEASPGDASGGAGEEAPETAEASGREASEGMAREEGASEEEEPRAVAQAETGAPEDQPSEAVPPQPPAADTAPFIEAVEIDGREVFVAGRAEPGRRLRVYANDILLGQTRVTPEGRFLIEAERDLPVGDYIIRADVLADDDVTVIARAAVPFERPQGEQIAAVAPDAVRQPPAPEVSREESESATPVAPTGEEGEDVATAQRDRVGEGEETAAPSTAPLAPEAETPLVAEAPPTDDDAFTDEAAAPAVPPDAGASGETAEAAADDPGPRDMESDDTALHDLAAETESETDASSAAPAPVAGGAAGDEQEIAAAAPADAPAAGQGAAADDMVVSPQLQPVEGGAVIIRRGDTLWQISRRVYGRGIRYTTIYTANQDQIRDPHWIWPGQIFTVPDQTREGEKADLEAIGDQALTLEEAARAQDE